MLSLSYAPDAWKCLNGIFCVFKPCGVKTKFISNTLRFNLCRDLNELEQREMSKIINLKGSVYSTKPFEVQVLPNYAEHEFVSGPRYQESDLKMKWVTLLGMNISGVSLIAVNNGCIKLLTNPIYKSLLRKYEIKGKFGMATNNFLADGKVVERSSFKHVKQADLDRVLASYQAAHHTSMYSGINLQTQEAYQLASSGIVRTCATSSPVVYSMKCKEFSLPHFTLEVQCINESELYLAELIHDIGIDLRTNATCTQLRCIQFGHFTLSHALLRKHWTLENILCNLVLCKAVLDEDPNSEDFQHIRQFKQTGLIQAMQNQVREDNI